MWSSGVVPSASSTIVEPEIGSAAVAVGNSADAVEAPASMPETPNSEKLPTLKETRWKPVAGSIVKLALPPMLSTCVPDTLIDIAALAMLRVSTPVASRVTARFPPISSTEPTWRCTPVTTRLNV